MGRSASEGLARDARFCADLSRKSDTPSVTITCPRCGLAFETQATTNTRCRRCRHVVRVGRSPARAVPIRLDDATSVDLAADHPTADEAAMAILTVASVVAGVLTLVVLGVAEAFQRWRGTSGRTLKSDDPRVDSALGPNTQTEHDTPWEGSGPNGPIAEDSV